MAELTAERLAEVRFAYSRSLYESMSIGPNVMTAWSAVPELLAEVDRLKAELAEVESAAADWAARLIEQKGRSGQAVSG